MGRAPICAMPFYRAPQATRYLAEQDKAPYTKKECLSCHHIRFMPRKDESCGACLAAFGGFTSANAGRAWE